jgi:hypothetical protein
MFGRIQWSVLDFGRGCSEGELFCEHFERLNVYILTWSRKLTEPASRNSGEKHSILESATLTSSNQGHEHSTWLNGTRIRRLRTDRRAANSLKFALNVSRSIKSIFGWFSLSIGSPFKFWGFSRGTPFRNRAKQRGEARVGASEDSGFPSTERVEKWVTPVAQVWSTLKVHHFELSARCKFHWKSRIHFQNSWWFKSFKMMNFHGKLFPDKLFLCRTDQLCRLTFSMINRDAWATFLPIRADSQAASSHRSAGRYYNCFLRNLGIMGLRWFLFSLSRSPPSIDRKSTRLNSSHSWLSRMPSSAW